MTNTHSPTSQDYSYSHGSAAQQNNACTKCNPNIHTASNIHAARSAYCYNRPDLVGNASPNMYHRSSAAISPAALLAYHHDGPFTLHAQEDITHYHNHSDAPCPWIDPRQICYAPPGMPERYPGMITSAQRNECSQYDSHRLAIDQPMLHRHHPAGTYYDAYKNVGDNPSPQHLDHVSRRTSVSGSSFAAGSNLPSESLFPHALSPVVSSSYQSHESIVSSAHLQNAPFSFFQSIPNFSRDDVQDVDMATNDGDSTSAPFDSGAAISPTPSARVTRGPIHHCANNHAAPTAITVRHARTVEPLSGSTARSSVANSTTRRKTKSRAAAKANTNTQDETFSNDFSTKCKIERIPRRSRNESARPTCDQCGEDFRGLPELDRHIAHSHVQATRFQCFNDPRLPQYYLPGGCKNCDVVKKTYPRADNAASHMRRCHYNPKSPQKGNQNRGGSSGGTDPPLSVMKAHGVIKEIMLNRVTGERVIVGADHVSNQPRSVSLSTVSNSITTPEATLPMTTSKDDSYMTDDDVNHLGLDDTVEYIPRRIRIACTGSSHDDFLGDEVFSADLMALDAADEWDAHLYPNDGC